MSVHAPPQILVLPPPACTEVARGTRRSQTNRRAVNTVACPCVAHNGAETVTGLAPGAPPAHPASKPLVRTSPRVVHGPWGGKARHGVTRYARVVCAGRPCCPPPCIQYMGGAVDRQTAVLSPAPREHHVSTYPAERNLGGHSFPGGGWPSGGQVVQWAVERARASCWRGGQWKSSVLGPPFGAVVPTAAGSRRPAVANPQSLGREG